MRLSMKLISVLGAIVLALTGVTIQADTPKAGGTLIMSIGTTPVSYTHLRAHET